MRPGNTIQFQRISYDDAVRLLEHTEDSLHALTAVSASDTPSLTLLSAKSAPHVQDPKLHVIEEDRAAARPRVVFRQVERCDEMECIS